MNRKLLIIGIIVFVMSGLIGCTGSSVHIHFDSNSRQQQYAATMLQKTFNINPAGRASYEVAFAIDTALGEEAFSLSNESRMICITGGDERGLIYGAHSLAEDIRNGIPLEKVQSKNEKPRMALRAVKYDLPWDTYRHSEALSLHSETCKDTTYWEAFLDMMAENRLNSLSLWNLHPYPFLIKAKNFPEASPFTDEELTEWQALFRAIFRMAKDRAIDTYIIPFNIFTTREFSLAHQVGLHNLDHHHYVAGDTSEVTKRYIRESVTQMLDEYPDLTGMGLTLGEGMGGMTPHQREQWMRETIIEGMRLANRKSKLVHRIPFSSTTESLGKTTVEMEQLTRQAIEAEADLGFVEGPIWADLKYNWSHAHSTPTLIKVHGGELFDTYYSPVPEKYKVTWTARNEDFFCLRWGVPAFVRAHVKENLKPYIGGYFIGSETYIPAKDYFTKDMTGVDWKYAFERQWLFYKLWGRLLYDPDTNDEVFHAEFVRRYGKEGERLLEASSLAGQTPLLLASTFDCGWDFTLYSEGFLALNPRNRVTNPTGPKVEYISADRLINQMPLDSVHILSVRQYVDALLADRLSLVTKTTPVQVADQLEESCLQALELVRDIPVKGNTSLRYEVADIQIWSYLGLHYAEKIRGAIALHLYRTAGGENHKQTAVAYMEQSLAYWDKAVAISRPLYNDMPLTHLSEQNGKPWQENDHLRFHWEIVRSDVARDVEIARSATFSK
ncbi:hypothetical protein M2137_001683 [Parabacteroides sp. PFB2-10]|uniref:hypothetical protein n=1 Tax=Parabacteroides sp. PFB2-10 TaxID=1742405 RepID=UPI002476807B|nr:hypothetical protein [Parabacteroides sp. PFB2-10]MDH6312898.1 hypothetical protein [Parabacteroides sp. PFB2-10]